MSAQPTFCCGPGYERLAAELAGLTDGRWVLTPGIHGVMVMANRATVPRELPGQPSPEAGAWWFTSVTSALTPTRRVP
jgi:hypothetical protein